MDLLVDLYRHQAWADAEHWRAIRACPPAIADTQIMTRLHHIHLVQRAFIWIARGSGEPFAFTKVDDFPDPSMLQAYAQAYHTEVEQFLASAPPERLNQSVQIPWFPEPPLTIEVREALLQCAMHSHYHRGQNATRLRELGGEPPPTDLIVWYSRQRPDASWP
jgi:uncharacterized damage-inducible protein DinB